MDFFLISLIFKKFQVNFIYKILYFSKFHIIKYSSLIYFQHIRK